MDDILNQYLLVFSPIITAIFLESAPFLCLGAFVSALLEVCLPQERLTQYVPKSPYWGLLLGLGAGLVFPTCECGVVPIARRLMKKGVPPHIAVPYMLAAPVINPIVLASTYVAFRGNIWMVLGRVLLVVIPATLMGLTLLRSNSAGLLREGRSLHDLNHELDSKSLTCSRGTMVLLHTGSEFLDMGKYLILGAFVVGLFKTFVPQETLLFVGDSLILAVGVMMALAVLLSICSEADAFVAVSFTSFPKVAQLSFVSIGPMVDLKLIAMWTGVFQRRLVFALVVGPTLMTFLISIILGELKVG
jgi:uncharacterized membrane protein YraQ (UPF0718 family)